MKAGFYPTHSGYFLRVPIESGSNFHLSSWHDGALAAKNRNIFLSADLFQILSDAFTINIDLVSEQTLREIEGAGTRV
ncbi:hypothetical protein MTR_3g032130 [Medicago truncatula]|uniref:Uncharacterized protein n=1 Tax=Medicago truncatula TaxID=3880 RepID=G7IWZ3_MEDTR|nr:hypothetical protein MTR_3g032130 [Medicago truncatula]